MAISLTNFLTLLIQGPLHRNTIKNILLNQDISRIVVLSWLCDSTLTILEELINLQNSKNNLKILMVTPPLLRRMQIERQPTEHLSAILIDLSWPQLY